MAVAVWQVGALKSAGLTAAKILAAGGAAEVSAAPYLWLLYSALLMAHQMG